MIAAAVSYCRRSQKDGNDNGVRVIDQKRTCVDNANSGTLRRVARIKLMLSAGSEAKFVLVP